MEENKKELPLVFWIGMIAVLVAGAVGIFALLEQVVPTGWEGADAGSGWQALLSKDEGPTAYTMRTLSEKERGSGDVKKWLIASGDYAAQELGGNTQDQVFWLYRQDSDEYVLYMPQQDRALTWHDVIPAEEKDEDGQVTLVLRIRTPENAEQIVPREQLLAFYTSTTKWNGIRISVILDGRQQQVYTLTSKGDELFTAAESYIGRH